MESYILLITRLVILVLFFLSLSHNAYAYLDPGTGSYIIQLIIAALLGGLFAAKQLRNKINIFFKGLVSRRKRHDKDDD